MVRKNEKARLHREKILREANAIAGVYGLKAEFLEGVLSVGVGGDNRTYTPVLVLVGSHPGDEQLAQLATRLGNELPINRITFELKRA